MSKYAIKNPNDPASVPQISALARKFSWVNKVKDFRLEKQIWACLMSFADPKKTKKKDLFTKEKAHLLFSEDIKVLPKIYKDSIKAYLKSSAKPKS